MTPTTICDTSLLRALALLTVFLASAPARAELPGAKDPDAYTVHGYAKELLAFHQHTMAEAYKQAGRRDPRWDDAALAFLDALAVNFTYDSVGAIYRPAAYPSYEQCDALASAAIEKGCDDPLVLFLHARVQELRGTLAADELAERYRQAYAGLRGGDYPAVRLAHAAISLLGYAADDDEREALTNARDDYMLRAAAGPFVNRGHRRIVLSLLSGTLDGAPVDARLAFHERLKAAPKADPWIVNVFGGNAHIRAAWRARGGGFANTVTEEGWRGFFAHLAEAERLLNAAWKLRPDHPEAPGLMITVAMGGGRRVADSTRDWFERAVTAQLDYASAYSRMFQALLPRWGGSHEAMLDLGLECARTERYDTEVPYKLVDAMERIRHDARDPALWKVPEAYESAVRVLDAYSEKYRDHPSGPWFASFHAALAWRLGKYEEARPILERLGDEVVIERFAILGGSPNAISEVYARTGPHAADVGKALDLSHHHKFEEALELFRTIDDKTDDADPANRYLKHRIVLLDRGVKFEAGEWVDLLPSDDLLIGHAPNAGTWRVDEQKRLVGTCDPRGGLFILCEFGTGPRYEMSVTLQRPEDPAVRLARPAIIFNHDYTHANGTDTLALMLDHEREKAELVAYHQPFRAVNGSMPDPVTVTIRCYDGRSQVTVEGLPQPLLYERPSDARAIRASLAGVGTWGLSDAGRIHVLEWKIRKLDDSPFDAP